VGLFVFGKKFVLFLEYINSKTIASQMEQICQTFETTKLKKKETPGWLEAIL
jgi:hypothetical protein